MEKIDTLAIEETEVITPIDEESVRKQIKEYLGHGERKRDFNEGGSE